MTRNDGSTHKTQITRETPEDAVRAAIEFHGESFSRHMQRPGEPLLFTVSARVLSVIREYCPDDVQIGSLSVSWDANGRYVLTDSAGREAYSEHGGGHVRSALEFLLSVRPEAKWKTVGLLKTLRQAFREDSANCRSDEIRWLLDRGPVRGALSLYIAEARNRDRAHHGTHTF